MIGRTLSHYKIVAELGRGGMGEVYRAEDTKLKRQVAIKVLPEEFAQDKERLARFEREAQLLASLSHPNIASIYGIEEADGVKALVLELVEGPTLAERIAQGRIPVDEAIAIAKQIAAALEAAHGDGVIHRDLKPANVKLTEDGQVKVLDFGLAKALQGDTAEPSDSELSQSPTLTRQGTAVGVILGTAAYMSPEQAKGKRVDRQTDVWAFGALVYEMLTGKRAFGGEDFSDTLAAVLRAEPDWSALPTDTPETIRQVLRLCLAKDRRNRLQAIGDVRLAMEGAYEVLSSSVQRSSPRLGIAAAFVLGSVITGVLVSNVGDPIRQTSPVIRFSVPLPESRGFRASDVAISPSGENLALRMGNDLYLRPLAKLDATLVNDDGPATSPFFSADEEWLFYFAQGQLQKVAVGGDMAPVVVCAVPGVESGASWGDDDTIVFAQSPGGIYRVAGSGGEPELIIALNENEFGQFPQALPGGEAILFTLRPSSSTPWEEAEIVVESLRTGERKVLVEGGRAGVYVPTGHLVYTHRRAFFAVPFDATSWEVGSVSVPLVERTAAEWPFSRVRNFDVSRSGALVYRASDASLNTTPVWLSRSGEERELRLPPKPYQWVHISPDGSRVVLGMREESGSADIWVHDFAEGVTSPFTFDAAADHYPIWTPDGRRIIFWSDRDGGGLFWKRSDGSGAVERLTSTTFGPSYAYGVSPDGKRLVFNISQGDDFDILTVTLDDEHTVEPLLESSYDERRASISPDGRWIAYMSDESGVHDVFVRPYPDVNGGQWRVSSDGGFSPRWARNGAALFYWKGQALMRVEVESDPTFSFSAPEKVLEGPYQTGARGSDDTLDGERSLLINEGTGATPEVHVVLNWIEELKARVPN